MVTAERTASTSESQATPERSQVAERIHPLRIQLPAEWELTDERFLEFCSLNEGWHVESDDEGGLWIVAPPGTESSEREANVVTDLMNWTRRCRRGRAIGSGLVQLPNGWRRAPDAAWISDERLAEIAGDNHIIWRVCPDFVVEVRSATDDLEDLQTKMEMWIAQGARLGWLVDPDEEAISIYRPEQEPQQIERPDSLTATEIADDLTIDFTRIWPQRDPAPETS
ncbi:MAG: Uma2 family endonuclease [Chloroflexi bacterium]|nr:Uma2 family endonuclease [Chloroflexota bacterium]MCY3697350.1 Uma2 family endonuclease [Chloroflexota bacterium]